MAARPTVLRAERVVTPTGILSPGEVWVDAGRIAAVRAGRSRRGAEAGSVLVPGFVDLQVNGAGRLPVPALRAPSDWEEVERALVAGGTTTWCATLLSASAPERAAALRRVAARVLGQAGTGACSPSAPHTAAHPVLAGAHLEGPFLGVPGAHPPEHLRSSVPGRWAARLPGTVRVVTLAPELPGALAAIAALARSGVLVALGHSRCTAEQAHAAAAAGARLVTHLGNAMGPMHQRDPGLLGAALADPALSVSLIADLVHVHPDLVRIAFAAKGADRVALVTDRVADDGRLAGADGSAGIATAHTATAGTGAAGIGVATAGVATAGVAGIGVGAAGAPPERRGSPDTRALARARARAQGLARRLPTGGLTGTGAGMSDMVAACVHGAGVDLAAAVAAASTTPARLLGLADRGVLAAGRRADLVELVDTGSWLEVRSVWIGGRAADGAWPSPTVIPGEPTGRRSQVPR